LTLMYWGDNWNSLVHWKQQGACTQNGVTQSTMFLCKFLANSIYSFPKHTGTALYIRYMPYVDNNSWLSVKWKVKWDQQWRAPQTSCFP
jgi:hypothetical protein